jgi:hypothetical protein
MLRRLLVREPHLVIPAPIHAGRMFIARALLRLLRTESKAR